MTETVVKQRWYKRGGFWLGITQVFAAVTWLQDDRPVGGRVFWAVWLALAVMMMIYGWRQGVAADARGVYVRRPVRRRFIPWEDVERFTGDNPPKVLTTDGRQVQLFDWAGDAAALHTALTQAKQAMTPPRTIQGRLSPSFTDAGLPDPLGGLEPSVIG